MIIYIFIEALKIVNMIKQGHTKEAHYVDDFAMWFYKAPKLFLNKNK